jgi:hypothetical protein
MHVFPDVMNEPNGIDAGTVLNLVRHHFLYFPCIHFDHYPHPRIKLRSTELGQVAQRPN